MRVLMLLYGVMGLVMSSCASAPGGGEATRASDSFSETFSRQAVAADHPLASAAGLEVLRQGGNAVDAAVATSLALSVVRPFSCGIGGGGFMVVHMADMDPPRPIPLVGGVVGRAPNVAINYREMAPDAMTAGFFVQRAADGDASASTVGATSAGVPGTVAGLMHAHEVYGRLSRRAVVEPAIRLARAGFEADEAYVRAARTIAAKFEASPAWKERFEFVWRRHLLEGRVEVGDRIFIPEQGDALELIARHGAQAFYEGAIAEAIVRASERDGGLITSKDLRAYTVRAGPALEFEAMGRRFVTMPPPSSGGVTMAQALGLLDRLWKESDPIVLTGDWPVRDANLGPSDAGQSVREVMSGPRGYSMQRRDALLIECFQLAFADRAAWLGDPAFVDVPVERLLSGEYLDRRAALVLASGRPRPMRDYLDEGAQGELLPDDAGTSHLSVVDRWGNAVACTETINLEFGSLLAVPEYGFILNDQMDDFATRPGEPNAFGLVQSARNAPAAGKRPLSSMTPTIVLDSRGRVEVVAGASGGPRIITGTTLATVHALHGWSAAEAVAAPRFHHQWAPARVDAEPEYASLSWNEPGGGAARTMREGLTDLGHEVREVERLCVVQLIRRVGDGWEAASDPRKGGRPAGD